MLNKWQEIWQHRMVDWNTLNSDDYRDVFSAMKKINGFDITDEGIDIEELIGQYEHVKNKLDITENDKVFEVGCGCGANLYMLMRDGVMVGGIDYSAQLIDIMRKILPHKAMIESVCGEAVDMPIDTKYDVVISNSVFSYFPDLNYAEEVLEKMLRKSTRSIGILDIHDLNKRDEFIAYRVKKDANYLKRYKGLVKLFYERSFFENFARKNKLKICFSNYSMKGYWNNDFVYHVYMYK